MRRPKEARQQADRFNHDHRSSAAESTEQLVDTMGGFGIAKPAVREWNARPRPRMPEHLLADCLTDQLRLRDPGVTGHASQRGLEFGRQVHAVQIRADDLLVRAAGLKA